MADTQLYLLSAFLEEHSAEITTKLVSQEVLMIGKEQNWRTFIDKCID